MEICENVSYWYVFLFGFLVLWWIILEKYKDLFGLIVLWLLFVKFNLLLFFFYIIFGFGLFFIWYFKIVGLFFLIYVFEGFLIKNGGDLVEVNVFGKKYYKNYYSFELYCRVLYLLLYFNNKGILVL